MVDLRFHIGPPPGDAFIRTGTPFQSDTLFGMFCHVYRLLFGEAALERDIIQPTMKRPVVTFSDAFPAGWFPRPLLPPMDDRGVEKLAERMGERLENKAARVRFSGELKRLKHRSFLPLAFLQQKGFRISELDVMEALLTEKRREDKQRKDGKKRQKRAGASDKKFRTEYLEPHNTLNRLTGTVEQEGGGFHHQRVFVFDSSLDVYIRITEGGLSPDIVKQVMQVMGGIGFGKDRSVGRGQFSVMKMETADLSGAGEGANACLLLSHCVPADSDELEYYRIETKYGKLGPDLRQLGLPPVKNPFVAAVPGSILKCQGQDLVGKVLTTVTTPGEKQVIQNTCGITVPVIIEDRGSCHA